MADKWWKTKEEWDRRFIDQDIPWDLGKPSPTLQSLEKNAELLPGSSVFVPGCGNGWDAMYFGRLGYKVSAVDWASVALEELRQYSRKEALDMELLKTDFFQIPKSWYWTFDVWVEHTFLSAVNPSDWPAYVSSSNLSERSRSRGSPAR